AGTSNLTLKPDPLNSRSESGLGVQANNTSATCTDPDCEINPPKSVAVTRVDGTLIKDAQIGSVQAGESFNFFVQTTEGGAFTQLNAAPITNTCSFPGGSVVGTDLCQWDAPAGQTRFGVAVAAADGGGMLIRVLAGRSPEPTTLLMVGTALVGLGAGWRRRLSKKA